MNRELMLIFPKELGNGDGIGNKRISEVLQAASAINIESLLIGNPSALPPDDVAWLCSKARTLGMQITLVIVPDDAAVSSMKAYCAALPAKMIFLVEGPAQLDAGADIAHASIPRSPLLSKGMHTALETHLANKGIYLPLSLYCTVNSGNRAFIEECLELSCTLQAEECIFSSLHPLGFVPPPEQAKVSRWSQELMLSLLAHPGKLNDPAIIMTNLLHFLVCAQRTEWRPCVFSPQLLYWHLHRGWSPCIYTESETAKIETGLKSRGAFEAALRQKNTCTARYSCGQCSIIKPNRWDFPQHP